MRTHLNEAPSGIEDAFQSSIERIEARPKEHRKNAFRLIAWILHAERPLRYDEIKHAFAIEPGNPRPDEEDFIPLASMLRSCAGLVTIDQDTQVLRLVHATASEFFLRRSLKPENFDPKDLARTCLMYLCMGSFRSGPCESLDALVTRSSEFPFLNHAAKHWGHYVARVGLEEDLRSSVSALLHNQGLRLSAFQALQHRPEITDRKVAEEVFNSSPTDQTALHIAAFWGLDSTVKELINPEEISATDSRSWTPLHWASCNDHLDIVRVLVNNGADVHIRDSSQWTPLFWTALRGNVEATQLLLDHGADHMMQDIHGSTPLHWAAYSGNEDVVRVILDTHRLKTNHLHEVVLVNAMDVSGNTPLGISAQVQHMKVFDVLANDASQTDAVINPLWKQGDFDPPTYNAWRIIKKGERSYGSADYIQRRGTSPLESSKERQSRMLHAAIRDDQLTIASLLIRLGADVDYQLNERAPLHTAAFRRDASFAALLLQNGADTSIKDLDRQTPLHRAVFNGFVEVVRALLEAGADPNAMWKPDSRGKRALHLPRRYSYPKSMSPLMLCSGLRTETEKDITSQTKIAEVLIEYGAKCLIQDDNEMHAFHHSARSKNAGMIKRLRPEVTDFDLPDKYGMTALHHAADAGHAPSVQAVLDAGTYATIRDARGLSACFYAVQSDCTASVAELIKSEDAIDASDEHRMTMLHWAVKLCNPSTVSLLLQRGASVDLRDEHGRNVLHHLATCNNDIDSTAEHDVFLRNQQEIFDLLKARLSSVSWQQEAPHPDFPFVGNHTPMSMAIASENYNMFEIMKISGGVLPMDVSSLVGHTLVNVRPDVLRCLVEHGAIVDVDEVTERMFGYRVSEDVDLSDLDDLLHQLSALTWDINGTGHQGTLLGPTLLGRVVSDVDSEGLVQLMIKHGADPYHGGAEKDPFTSALTKCHLKALRGLIADRPEAGSEGHWTHVLPRTSSSDDVELLRLVCEAFESSSTFKYPLLAMAIKHRHFEHAEKLITAGASLQATDKGGWSALHWAIFHKQTNLVRMLLKLGLSAHDATTSFEGYLNETASLPRAMPENQWAGTPLHLAVLGGSTEIVEMLLDLGVDVNADTSYEDELSFPGRTPLRIALQTSERQFTGCKSLGKERLTSARMLLDRGANIQGAGDHLKFADLAHFQAGFADVWNTIRHGLTIESERDG
jgi:ankyrin repeat protein